MLLRLLSQCSQNDQLRFVFDYNKAICSSLKSPAPSAKKQKTADEEIEKLVEESDNVDDSSLETDIRQKDEKSSKNGQNRARNGKAWKSQSQIEAKGQRPIWRARMDFEASPYKETHYNELSLQETRKKHLESS
ncbi:hypothetical protein Tco_0866140 [Tanacetum coccineum]